jgi:hypothetical protein
MVLRIFRRPSLFFKSLVLAAIFFACKPLFKQKFGLQVEEFPLIALQENGKTQTRIEKIDDVDLTVGKVENKVNKTWILSGIVDVLR